MRIGTLELEAPVIAAPMAGVSNSPYRLLAREAGAGLVCSEMISAKGLVYSPNRTEPLLSYYPAEKPISFQIFGSEPVFMARAARYIEGLGADIIDINMGCPVSKVVKGGEGCALMQNPRLAGDIVASVKGAVSVPVTVKIRKGWDDTQINAVEMAVLAAENGAAAVTIHGRTREQFYGGKADWQIIRQVTKAIVIPVIGSGDIFSPQDALNMLGETGCAGVMVARGALGNPWIFSRIRALMQGEVVDDPSPQEKIEMALRHMELLVVLKGEKVGIREMRKHASWYIKGLKGAAFARREIYRAEDRRHMAKALTSILNVM